MDELLNLHEGNRGPAVERLQGLLNKYFFSSLLVEDGIFCPETKKYLEDFQIANNIPLTSIVDHTTLTYLKEVDTVKDPRFLTQESPMEILKIQAQLMCLYPYHPRLPQDELTLLSSETRDLLRYFQNENHIRVSGECDYLTRKTLHEAVLERRNGRSMFVWSHNTAHIAQTYRNSCWAASAAMLHGESEQWAIQKLEGQVWINEEDEEEMNGYNLFHRIRRRNRSLGNVNDGLLTGRYHNKTWTDTLLARGDEHVPIEVVEKKFAEIYNFNYRMYLAGKEKMPVIDVCKFIKKGPIMFNILYEGYTTFEDSLDWHFSPGYSPGGHFRVINSVVSDNDASGNGTYLEIIDPLPINNGSLYYRYYNEVVNHIKPVNLIFTKK